MEIFSAYKPMREAIEQSKTSCAEIVAHYLEENRKQNHLNAFLEIFESYAIEKAKAVDQKFKEGTAGPLAGLVVGIKDLLCMEGFRAQAGSKILDGFESQFSGTAVKRLIDADAIIIGRQNCDEFGMGSSNENSAFGPVKNAIDESRVPGGSSGGSAVAVQANLCQVSLGTDTGGSVRQPASFCGIVGLKPTYSRISRYGLIAYASSFDTIGIFSKNVEDNARVLAVIAGKDEFDSTVSQHEVPNYLEQLGTDKKYKIGYIQDTLDSEGLSEDIKENTLKRIAFLKGEGHNVEPVEFSLLKYALPTYYILTTAEAGSNLSRFDGVKYGFRSPHAHDLESMYKLSRSEGFGKEVQRRIMLGTFVLSASYYDAFYTKAQKVRRLIKDKSKELLEDHDFILLPTAPTTAFKFGAHSKTPLEMYLDDLFTVQANVAGLPAISIPNGVDRDGLPIGLQIMAGPFEEEKIYAFADYLMRNN